MTPMLKMAVTLLLDGEWHDLEEILRELSKLVPPGRAVRRNETDRRLSSGTPVRRVTRGSEDRLIASGKRAIAKDMLNKSYFEIYPPGKVKNKRVRMTQVPARYLYEQKHGGDHGRGHDDLPVREVASGE
jgi:hypothetical protein